MLRVRDLSGRTVCYLDGDNAIPRDDSGKVIGERAGSDEHTTDMTRMAARWITGQRALLDLAPFDVNEPTTQADFGIASLDRECVADVVSPVTYVKKLNGYWYTESVKDSIQLVITNVDLSGQPPVISPGFAATLFTTTSRALAVRIPRQVMANADFDLKARATRRLVEALRLSREDRVATLLTTATSFAASNRVAAAARWNGGSGTPLTDLFAALAKSYMMADTLIMPEVAAPFFFANNTSTQVRDYVQSGGQMPRILYARSKKLFGGVPAYTWMPTGLGNVTLVRTTTADDGRPDWAPPDRDTDIGTSATFRWIGEGGVRSQKMRPGDKTARIDGVLVREFVDTSDSSGATMIVVVVNDTEVIVSNLVGSVITGAMA